MADHEMRDIAKELREAEGLAAPHPNYPGKESSLHREGLLLDAARLIESLQSRQQLLETMIEETEFLKDQIQGLEKAAWKNHVTEEVLVIRIRELESAQTAQGAK